ncbi:hypothetical protein, partial [Rhodococcus sp. JVH1]|uniref:hypothetical protein n=1 Tax=Rhodococcus sp. JVH1 TaxID=745408 RepID=UPI001ED969EE
MSSELARRTELEDQILHFGGIPANAIAAGVIVEAIFVFTLGDSEGNQDVFLRSSTECGPTSEELNHEVIFTRACEMFLDSVRHCCPYPDSHGPDGVSCE